MTVDGKAAELASWAALKTAYLKNPPAGYHGGLGYPDVEMFRWVDLINAEFSGLCTLQSCAGHHGPGGDHFCSGQLWLWPTHPMAAAIDVFAFEIAQDRQIERLSMIYHDGGQQIVDVRFRGAERGELDSSMALIVTFLERCRKAAYGR